MTDSTNSARLSEIDWLVGEWRGYGVFSNRTTYIHKSFSYEIGGKFLVEKTIDMFPPDTPSTEFEIHQDQVFYFLNADKLEAVGFYGEGFVNCFNLTVEQSAPKLIAQTYDVKNAPSGIRARITYEQEGDDHLQGIFELAMPGKQFDIVEKLTMERIK